VGRHVSKKFDCRASRKHKACHVSAKFDTNFPCHRPFPCSSPSTIPILTHNPKQSAQNNLLQIIKDDCHLLQHPASNSGSAAGYALRRILSNGI
jgi:hypothetical protein